MTDLCLRLNVRRKSRRWLSVSSRSEPNCTLSSDPTLLYPFLMSSHLTLPRSDNGSSRASHILPTVKCSSCSQPVPLTSLGAHVCSPQHPPPSPSKYKLSSQQQFVPNQQPRLRSDSQSVPRPRPSFIKPPAQDATSHVPFPTVSTPPPRPEDYMPGGESGMAGVGRRAFQAAAHAAIHQHQQLQYPYTADLPTRNPGSDYSSQFLDITGSSGRGQSSDRGRALIDPSKCRYSTIIPEFHPFITALSFTPFTTHTIPNCYSSHYRSISHALPSTQYSNVFLVTLVFESHSHAAPTKDHNSYTGGFKAPVPSEIQEYPGSRAFYISDYQPWRFL